MKRRLDWASILLGTLLGATISIAGLTAYGYNKMTSKRERLINNNEYAEVVDVVGTVTRNLYGTRHLYRMKVKGTNDGTIVVYDIDKKMHDTLSIGDTININVLK